MKTTWTLKSMTERTMEHALYAERKQNGSTLTIGELLSDAISVFMKGMWVNAQKR